jgi:hypothetical protein
MKDVLANLKMNLELYENVRSIDTDVIRMATALNNRLETINAARVRYGRIMTREEAVKVLSSDLKLKFIGQGK